MFHAYTHLGETQFHHFPQWEEDMQHEILGGHTMKSVQVANEDIAVLELFTILLYDRTSDLVSIDEDRKAIFYQKWTSHGCHSTHKSSSYATKMGITGGRHYKFLLIFPLD